MMLTLTRYSLPATILHHQLVVLVVYHSDEPLVQLDGSHVTLLPMPRTLQDTLDILERIHNCPHRRGSKTVTVHRGPGHFSIVTLLCPCRQLFPHPHWLTDPIIAPAYSKLCSDFDTRVSLWAIIKYEWNLWKRRKDARRVAVKKDPRRGSLGLQRATFRGSRY
jgi:hypothetical protein